MLLKSTAKNNHDTDFYTWTQEQAALLRNGHLAELDIANLIEELEDMGRSEQRALDSHLSVLLEHLLKWRFQPMHRNINWEGIILRQRLNIKRVLTRNQGLNAILPESFRFAYSDARLVAMSETGLKLELFPLTCPWSIEQVLNDYFWPN